MSTPETKYVLAYVGGNFSVPMAIHFAKNAEGVALAPIHEASFDCNETGLKSYDSAEAAEIAKANLCIAAAWEERLKPLDSRDHSLPEMVQLQIRECLMG